MGKVIHIVLWKLKQAGGAEALESAKAAVNKLRSVPGAEIMQLGPPISTDRAKGYDYALYSVFSSREALEKYAVSAKHVQVRDEEVKPNTTDALAYDIELE